MKLIIKDYINSMTDETLSKVLGLIKNSAQPCFDLPGYSNFSLLKECYLYDQRIDCNKVFQSVVTDFGLCCGFNIGNKDEKIVPRVGKQNGLRVVLDQASGNVDFGTVFDVANSFNVHIGSPYEFPMLKLKKNNLEPGKEHSMQISATVINSDPEIVNIDPLKRDCYFHGEKQLTLFKEYSYSTCQMECAIFQNYAKYKCIPWFLPKEKGWKICDPWTSMKFVNNLGNATNCQCLQSCSAVIYSTSTSSAKFQPCNSRNFNLSPMCKILDEDTTMTAWLQSAKNVYDDTSKDLPLASINSRNQMRPAYFTTKMAGEEIFTNLAKDTPVYDAFKDDIAVLNVFFSEATTIEFGRTARYTFFNFVASLGGFFGLFLGFSVISLLEIIYWFVIIMARRLLA
eukprot:TRINITY_DN32353_c0_g2_i1.p1 TRINITY_DN32353_c0_g2~~TRINITY_DN32353_c0_g2_i1.p1  ORF type:complete len:431 (-),score=50.76 TRINITY_DN32353_c0_g2_i1:35-1228(-)